MVSVTEAEKLLGTSRATLYRWLASGFITGEQHGGPSGPWRIRVDDELHAKIAPEVPTGWVGLDEAARRLGVARQTVLDRVRRGELNAVHVNRGQRKGLAIDITPAADALFPASAVNSSQAVHSRRRPGSSTTWRRRDRLQHKTIAHDQD